MLVLSTPTEICNLYFTAKEMATKVIEPWISDIRAPELHSRGQIISKITQELAGKHDRCTIHESKALSCEKDVLSLKTY